MDKRIILAAAGSGKTYYVANDFNKDERVILLSFTNSNVSNIQLEIMKRFNGIIPSHVHILTFDSFVYNFLLKPIEPLFLKKRSNGVDIKTMPVENRGDPRYIKQDKVRHYVNKSNEYYVSRMGKLFSMYSDIESGLVIERLEKYCDVIYIDEFQDYNGYDFKVIKYLLEKTKIKVVAVGDINQSCLTTIRNRGTSIAKKPFYSVRNIEDLKNELSEEIDFDCNSLIKSRRVPIKTCEFISKYMGIDIKSSSSINGTIKFIDDINEINNLIQDNDIPKLVWNKTVNNPIDASFINWSYSKGDTYSKACIILTKSTDTIENWVNAKNKTRNALYVALTRSRGDTYIIKSSSYKKWCNYVNVSS